LEWGPSQKIDPVLDAYPPPDPYHDPLLEPKTGLGSEVRAHVFGRRGPGGVHVSPPPR